MTQWIHRQNMEMITRIERLKQVTNDKIIWPSHRIIKKASLTLLAAVWLIMGWLAVVGLKYLLRCSHQVLLSWLSLAAQLYSFRRWIHQFAYVIYSFSIVLVNQTKLGKPIVPDGEPLGLKPKLDVFDVILVGPQPSCTLFWPLKNWGEKIHFTSLTMGRVHWLVSPSGFSFFFFVCFG